MNPQGHHLGPDGEPLWEPPALDYLQALLPQYRFLRIVSSGGMGAVYEAVQLTLDRTVAIKVLRPGIDDGETDFATRFKTEARLMAKLGHSGIINVYDFGQTSDGHLYLVMEFVEGHTLHEVIFSDGRVAQEQALGYARQLCDALQYAHDHGIVHRDIKPANILINANGRVKIADFGLARPIYAYEQEVLLGTPDYVAPEVMQDPSMVDHRADIYSLGIVIHEMLTGYPPGKGQRGLADFSDIDPNWSAIVHKATRPSPRQRYEQVSELMADLARIGSKPRETRPVPDTVMGIPAGVIWSVFGICLLGVGFWYWRHQAAKANDNGGANVAEEVTPSSQSKPAAPVTPTPVPPAVAANEPPAAPKSKPPEETQPVPDPVAISQEALHKPYHLPEMTPGHVFQFQEAHRDPINNVELLPDGYRVATSSFDGTVKIWNIHQGKAIHTLGPVEGRVTALAVSPDGKYLASGDGNYTVSIWDVESGAQKAKAAMKGRFITALAFSSDASRVAAGTTEMGNSLEFWDWQKGAEPEVQSEWRTTVLSIAPIPDHDGKLFLTAGGGFDQMFGRLAADIKIAAFDRSVPAQAVPVQMEPATKVAVSSDGKIFAVDTAKGIHAVDLASGKILGTMQPETRPLSLCLLDRGRLLLTGHNDKTFRIWECATGQEVYRATAETLCTSAVAVSADETYAVSGGGYGDKGVKDGDYAPHLWALPKLSTLVTEGGRMAAVRQNIDNLSKVDQALADLRQKLISEWEEKFGKETAGPDQSDLDTKYVQALQRNVAGTPASVREFYLGEISRVANKGNVPSQANGMWPPALKHLFEIYVQQLDLLKSKAQKERDALADAQHQAVAKLVADRQAAKDEQGVLRAQVVLEEIDHMHQPPAPVAAQNPAPTNQPPPNGMPMSPMVEGQNGFTQVQVPPLAADGGLKLQRPQRLCSVVAWSRSGNASAEALGHVPENLGPVVALSVGERHALALKADGTVVSWGHEDAQLLPPPPNLDHVVAVAAGPQVSMCLREDGAVVAWNTRRQILIPSDIKQASGIFAGYNTGYLSYPDGTLVYLSPNAAPIMMTPPQGVNQPDPTRPTRTSVFDVPGGINDVADLNALQDGVFALLKDGTLREWGRGTRLMRMGPGRRPQPQQSNAQLFNPPYEKLKDGISIAIGTDCGWFLKQSGQLVAWGSDLPTEFSRDMNYPGAIRLFRACPSNGVAVLSSTGSWRFISAEGRPYHIDTLLAERNARGCIFLGIGMTHIVGLKPM